MNQLVNTGTDSAAISEPETDIASQSEPNISDSLKLNQALRLAEKVAKEGDAEEAKRIYQNILAKFPKNKKAQQGLANLNKPKQPTATQGPPKGTINQLLNLYNQGQLEVVVEQAQALIKEYPEAFAVWNILGAAHKGLGNNISASEAFNRVIELHLIIRMDLII